MTRLSLCNGGPQVTAEKTLYSRLHFEMVTLVNSDEQYRALREHARATNKPLFVQFSASWCGPCRRIYPDFEKLSTQASAHAIFAKVDVDSAQESTHNANVAAMPTFHAYHGDRLVESMSGADREALVALVTRTLRSLVDDVGAAAAGSNDGTQREGDRAVSPTVVNAAGNDGNADDGTRAAAQDFAGKVVLIDSDEEWASLLQYANARDLPIIVQFSASWCGPCQRIYPVLGEFCRQAGPAAVFAKVDIDQAVALTQAVGVKSVPAFLGLYADHVVDGFADSNAERLEQLVNATLRQASQAK